MTFEPSSRIADVLAGTLKIGDAVTVHGWVRTRRDSKAGLSFVAIHDGSCFDAIQLVVPASLENYEDEVQHLTTGCSLTARGTLVESQGKGQSVEVSVETLTVHGWVEDPETYPMQPKRHSREYLREVAHLRPRTNLIGAVTRVRNCLAQATHRFFHERGYCWIHTPIITASDAEGAGEMFRVSTLDLQNLPRTDQGAIDFTQDFFGREAHLTVSGQLNVEAYCLALDKCYTFGPTFRAENSNTRRHLAEFWMIEPEIAFADLDDNATLAADLLQYLFRTVLAERADDMKFFNQFVDKGLIERLEKLVAADFARIDYRDAVKELESSGKKFEFPVHFGADLQAEHERFLTENVVKGPVTVVNYPKTIKAFYMRLNDDEETVAAMDVLAPGIGEIIGGSQREERLDVLDGRIREIGLSPDDYGWYRDLRRYGTVPHAGFGLGFERTVLYATGLDNVRDAIPFPRTPGSTEF
ncbi:MAG: asparagine--tRNA ligase [Myxococcota bacterium]